MKAVVPFWEYHCLTQATSHLNLADAFIQSDVHRPAHKVYNIYIFQSNITVCSSTFFVKQR